MKLTTCCSFNLFCKIILLRSNLFLYNDMRGKNTYISPVRYRSIFSTTDLFKFFSVLFLCTRVSINLYFANETLVPLCWWMCLIFLSLMRSDSPVLSGFLNVFYWFSGVLLSPWQRNPPPSWRKPLCSSAEANWERVSRGCVYRRCVARTEHLLLEEQLENS